MKHPFVRFVALTGVPLSGLKGMSVDYTAQDFVREPECALAPQVGEGYIETVPGGQFWWGTSLLKSNGGVHQGWLAPDGHRSDSVKAQASLTATRMCGADAKAGPSEPTVARRSAEDQQIKATPGITG
jgi:hypothetical protein